MSCLYSRQTLLGKDDEKKFQFRRKGCGYSSWWITIKATNRKVRVHGDQFSPLRIHRQQLDDLRQRDHGIFRRRIAVYQRSYRRRCTSRTAETRERPKPCRPHHANACTDRWPLTFVLRSSYFQYNGSIYEQKDGAAMGSPVSAVIANLYMESFEEQAITTSSYEPRIWKRYVNDTFTILDRKNVEDENVEPWRQRKTTNSPS